MAAGDDITRTDLFLVDELLTPEERDIRDRVRRFVDAEVLPVINDYWERAEFPYPLVPGLGGLRIAGGALRGDGCPGMSPVAEGLVAAELARADGGLRVFCVGHGLAMMAVGLLGSAEQRSRWLPKLAAMETIGAFAMTEPAARVGRLLAGDARAARRRGVRPGRRQALDRQRHLRGRRRGLGPRRRR